MPESERERFDRAAICVYRCKDHEKEAARIGGLISLRYNRVVIQSQQLIKLIRPTLVSAGAAVPETGYAEFLHPFQQLYFAYDKLMRLWENHHHSSAEFKLLKILEETMGSLFADLSATVALFRSKGSTNYACLWTLFPKGMVVYKKLWDGSEQLYRVSSTEPVFEAHKVKEKKGEERNVKLELGLMIHLERIVFAGSNFGVEAEFFRINTFEGEKKVIELPVYPVSFIKIKT